MQYLEAPPKINTIPPNPSRKRANSCVNFLFIYFKGKIIFHSIWSIWMFWILILISFWFFFLKLAYSTMCGTNCQICVVHISRKCIGSRHCYSCPSTLKTRPQVLAITTYSEGNYSFLQVAFIQKSVFPKKGTEETMICFIKIQSENTKMTWNIALLIFCIICSFF